MQEILSTLPLLERGITLACSHAAQMCKEFALNHVFHLK